MLFEQSPKEVLRSLKSSESGLSHAEVMRRLEAFGPNQIRQKAKKDYRIEYLKEYISFSTMSVSSPMPRANTAVSSKTGVRIARALGDRLAGTARWRVPCDACEAIARRQQAVQHLAHQGGDVGSLALAAAASVMFSGIGGQRMMNPFTGTASKKVTMSEPNPPEENPPIRTSEVSTGYSAQTLSYASRTSFFVVSCSSHENPSIETT